ncbi:hypothetical protein [Devosia marina]|uniref:Uncharacterized protein n=1 Tax=Devosia marina TaxID=2683198 RepID=A0A7X3FTJ9_9HYPH|nr:hypothetical protein [Devosia marina]MVT00485.1 hypothetical protein [Devosia marina]
MMLRAIFVALSEGVRWSSLSKIGNSRIATITIFAPIIGYLVVFNSTLSEYVALVSPFGAEPIGINAIDYLHSKRLYFLYLGVLGVGLATALYAALAPEPIKTSASAVDYVRHMSDLNTPNIVRDSFLSTISLYRRYNNEEQRHPMFSGGSLSSLDRVSSALHPFIRSMFEGTDTDIDILEHDALDYGDEARESLVTGSGNVRTDSIMEILQSGRNIDRPFQYEFLNEVVKNPKDVFFLEYISLDYSAFARRVTVAVVYAVGFTLLLVPTITTLGIIFRSW